ncbi:lactate utilization protein B [Nitratifractor sp.]
MIDHAGAAAEFLGDRTRAKRHDEALWFVRQKRDAAAGSLPEWEALRSHAQRIKEHTLAHLGYYLERFETNARANGIEVYWARDAAECNAIVERLLAEEGARSIVKSKSMLTEECGLNPYLEARGYEVTDTDLGERIIQLAGDRPSHIVLPAIHLSKEEVGTVFHETMGTPEGLSDPEALTRAARRDLRGRFLCADAAITGVNFALAEEGGIVVCTNEGNADLGCAIAPLHIACMGIEKVIPSARELGVFTRLLARSATGQAITAYTSHFHAPRPGGRLAVVIVDNGRSERLRNESELLRCIRCGACMNTCPVYRRSGGHSYGSVTPGPVGSALRASADPADAGSLAFACTLCGSCDAVCPVRIPLHERLRIAREAALAAPTYAPKRRILKLAAWVVRDPRRLEWTAWLWRLADRILPGWILERLGGPWSRERTFPRPAPRRFSEMMEERNG